MRVALNHGTIRLLKSYSYVDESMPLSIVSNVELLWDAWLVDTEQRRALVKFFQDQVSSHSCFNISSSIHTSVSRPFLQGETRKIFLHNLMNGHL